MTFTNDIYWRPPIQVSKFQILFIKLYICQYGVTQSYTKCQQMFVHDQSRDLCKSKTKNIEC